MKYASLGLCIAFCEKAMKKSSISLKIHGFASYMIPSIQICTIIIAPRLKSWNLRSGISSPKPTGCCLGDLEAHLKIALLSQIGQWTVIF